MLTPTPNKVLRCFLHILYLEGQKESCVVPSDEQMHVTSKMIIEWHDSLVFSVV